MFYFCTYSDHEAGTLAYVLCGIAVIHDQEMEFSRPMHTNGELQLDVSRAAGASHKRHATRQILLRVSPCCLHQEEKVGQGRNDLRGPCHGHVHGWQERHTSHLA